MNKCRIVQPRGVLRKSSCLKTHRHLPRSQAFPAYRRYGRTPDKSTRKRDRMTTSSTLRWLITGVSSGFGRALAEAALSRGDQVTGTFRSEAARLAFTGIAPGRSTAKLLDIRDEAAIRATIAATEADGRIDILLTHTSYAFVAPAQHAML